MSRLPLQADVMRTTDNLRGRRVLFVLVFVSIPEKGNWLAWDVHCILTQLLRSGVWYSPDSQAVPGDSGFDGQPP